MSRLGFWEVALIVVAVLVIFGPAKLPQLGKSLGQGLREFKKSVSSTQEDQPSETKPEQETEKKS